MNHIFVSYQHGDGDFADVLMNKLEKEGYSIWVDNEKINAGEDWRNEIDQAIKEAFALIVIMSPEAKASEYVTYEWAFAWGAGVKVIPVLFKPTKLHPRLEALQYLDFTSRTSRPWDKLLTVVKNAANVFDPNMGRVQEVTLYDLLPDCTVRVSFEKSMGTGFFVATGLILTCAHVVAAAHQNQTPITVYWNDQSFHADIKELRNEEILIQEKGMGIKNLYPDLALLQVNLISHPWIPSRRLWCAV